MNNILDMYVFIGIVYSLFGIILGTYGIYRIKNQNKK